MSARTSAPLPATTPRHTVSGSGQLRPTEVRSRHLPTSASSPRSRTVSSPARQQLSPRSACLRSLTTVSRRADMRFIAHMWAEHKQSRRFCRLLVRPLSIELWTDAVARLPGVPIFNTACPLRRRRPKPNPLARKAPVAHLELEPGLSCGGLTLKPRQRSSPAVVAPAGDFDRRLSGHPRTGGQGAL